VALHFADGVAMVYEDRWLNPAALDAAPSFESISANEWLVAHVPFTTGEIAFSAAPADAAQAAALGLPPGAPLFVAERTTWIGAVPITLVRLSHAPGYRLCTRL
jgi:GntR family transcriptional regulator, histidine utilization repressor